MKKIILTILMLLSVSGLCIAGGCTPESGIEGGNGGTGIEIYQSGYAGIGSAVKIEETIQISDGRLIPYIYEATYQKGEGVYTVTETEKNINAIITGEEEEYTSTTTEKQAQTAETSVTKLDLNTANLKSLNITATTLKAEIAEDKLGEVLGLKATMPATVDGAELTLTLSGTKLTDMLITYSSKTETSKTYSVTITLSFTY